MNNDWYSLDLSSGDREKQNHIRSLREIIHKLFQNQRFWDDVMVFSPKKKDGQITMVWIIPPKTVNLGLEKTLILCGAEKCPQPNINEVSVTIGNEQDVHVFFPDE